MRGTRWVAATLPIAVLLEHVGGSLAEERQLRARFGDEYTRYADRVRRYTGRRRQRRTRASAATS
jgi:protein-S-isoprenylcysteine O-methyltransferase Ste14